MRQWLRDSIPFALILLLALAGRVGGALWWESKLPEGSQFQFGDSETYWQYAKEIAQGEFNRPNREGLRCSRTPGYPLLLSPLFLLSDKSENPDGEQKDANQNGLNSVPPVLWGRLLTALLSTLAVAGVISLAYLLFNKPTALVAGTIAAIYPGAIAMGSLVLTEAPFTALMLLQIILMHLGWRAAERGRFVSWMFAAGAVAGLATLVRPSWILFTPLIVLVAIMLSKERRRHLLAGACLTLGLCLAMAPWWIRNYQIYDRFVPTTLQVGASLYDGLSAGADGGSNMDFVPPIAEEFRNQRELRLRLLANPPVDESRTTAAYECKLNQEFRNRAITWAKENPGRTVQLAGSKFLRTWNLWPNEPSFRSLPLRLVVLLTYGPVMLLALVGVWRYSSRGWPIVLCVAPAVYFSLLHVVFVGSIRYRQPAMLPLIVLAAAVVVDWWFNRRRIASRLGPKKTVNDS